MSPARGTTTKARVSGRADTTSARGTARHAPKSTLAPAQSSEKSSKDKLTLTLKASNECGLNECSARYWLSFNWSFKNPDQDLQRRFSFNFLYHTNFFYSIFHSTKHTRTLPRNNTIFFRHDMRRPVSFLKNRHFATWNFM